MALGNKEIMAKNIKRYMASKGVNQTEMAYAIGVKYMTLSDWIHAKTYPRIDKIELMARYFGVNKSDLVEDELSSKPKAIRVPVLGYVAAGIPISAITEILDFEEVTPDMAAGRELFALKIKGDSMAPRICSGDVVICTAQPDAESGEICIVQVNSDEATCKKIRKHRDGIELIPLNPCYEPIYYTSQQITELPVVIIGKVVELRGKF